MFNDIIKCEKGFCVIIFMSAYTIDDMNVWNSAKFPDYFQFLSKYDTFIDDTVRCLWLHNAFNKNIRNSS